MKRLRPFFKFYGSKYRIAPKYPAPEFETIVEPFAGSASYSTLHADRKVVLVENDPDVAALWQWLIRTPGSEIRRLPVCPDLPAGFDIRNVEASREAQLLIRYWQRVGRSRCWTISKWGHLSGFWCAATRDRVAAQVDAIRHWRAYFGDLPARPAPIDALTWFLDPPYQAQSTVYGAAPDLPALARWTRQLRGQVIVCEAPGSTWLPFRPFTTALNGPAGSGDGRKQRPELIWTGP